MVMSYTGVFDGLIQKAEIDRKVAEEVAREEFAVSTKFLFVISEDSTVLSYVPCRLDEMDLKFNQLSCASTGGIAG